jgi:tetratricopeptide (TPR) repeat protein
MEIRRLHAEAAESISHGEDYDLLNSLSLAETDRMVYLAEKDRSRLDAGNDKLLELSRRRLSNSEALHVFVTSGDLKITGKSYQEAAQDLKKALSYNPSATEAALIHSEIDNCLAASNDMQEAQTEYKKAEDAYPEAYKFVFYSNYGYILLRDNRFNDSIDYLRRALEIKQDDWYSRLNLGFALEGIGEYDQAEAEYNKVIASNATDVKNFAYVLLGRAEEIQKQPAAKYLANFLLATGRAPTPDELHLMQSQRVQLGQLYRDAGAIIANGNSFGLDPYIDWFNKKATEIEQGR